MKKSIALILIAALTLQIGLACAEYMAIRQLKTSAPARWQETYQAHGRTVSIDVEVQIPDAEAFPVVTSPSAGPRKKRPQRPWKPFPEYTGTNAGIWAGASEKNSTISPTPER